MPDYGGFCPINLTTDVLADRWTPLIVRELVLGNTRFNDIARGLPGISRSLLVQRLKHLERKGVVELWPSPTGRGNEYHLTPAGKGLEPVIIAMGRWAVEHIFEEIRPEDIDAVTLTWWMHRRSVPEELPQQRVVVQLDYTAPERVTLWMVLEHGKVSVCMQHPGFDSDLCITTTTPKMSEVFSGYCTFDQAIRDGSMRFDGPPSFVSGFRRWFAPSPFFEATQAQLAERAAARTG
jgi:DNA-binding HxlR family transcriptional regulator